MARKIISIPCFIIFALSIGGCAKDATHPTEVPALYVPTTMVDPVDRCAAITAEIESLDAGLGGPAADSGPLQPATAGARWGSYGKNLVAQSLMGPFQPLIQTIRAANNSEDKENRAADRSTRAATRRAYLQGSYDGANCARFDGPDSATE